MEDVLAQMTGYGRERMCKSSRACFSDTLADTVRSSRRVTQGLKDPSPRSEVQQTQSLGVRGDDRRIGTETEWLWIQDVEANKG